MTMGKVKSIENTQKGPESSSPGRAFARQSSVSMSPGGFDTPLVPQMAGNLAVQQLFRSGHIQAKLAISQPGDPDEEEADRVAEQVMRKEEPVSIGSSPSAIQRKCAACESRGTTCPKCEEEQTIQHKENPGPAAHANPPAHSQIATLRGGGQPLPPSARAFFEPRFGQDFSGVRVHTDEQAAESALAMNALAYTVGSNVVFGAGQYAPGMARGRELLAHELTHVVQQTGKPQTRAGIQRFPLLGNGDKTGSEKGSDGGILDWVEKKAGGVVSAVTGAVTSITDAPGAAVDWARQQASAAIQAGEEAVSPAALEKAKGLAGLLKCKLSIGKDGLIIRCPRIKLTDPLEEKVWSFPSLSKAKNLKDYVIPGVNFESPTIGLDIGPSLWLSVGTVTLDNVVIRIDPFKDTYIGEGQLNVPIGSHLVAEIAGKISSGVTASIPIAEGASIPIKGFGEGGFRGEGIGSTLMNFLQMVRLSYIDDKFNFDLNQVIKAAFKIQFNVTPFLNVQYQIAERAKNCVSLPHWCGPGKRFSKPRRCRSRFQYILVRVIRLLQSDQSPDSLSLVRTLKAVCHEIFPACRVNAKKYAI